MPAGAVSACSVAKRSRSCRVEFATPMWNAPHHTRPTRPRAQLALSANSRDRRRSLMNRIHLRGPGRYCRRRAERRAEARQPQPSQTLENRRLSREAARASLAGLPHPDGGPTEYRGEQLDRKLASRATSSIRLRFERPFQRAARKRGSCAWFDDAAHPLRSERQTPGDSRTIPSSGDDCTFCRTQLNKDPRTRLPHARSPWHRRTSVTLATGLRSKLPTHMSANSIVNSTRRSIQRTSWRLSERSIRSA